MASREFLELDHHLMRQTTCAIVQSGVYFTLIGSVVIPDKSGSDVFLFVLSLFQDLEVVVIFSWRSVVLVCLYRELCHATRSISNQIVGPLILQYLKVGIFS